MSRIELAQNPRPRLVAFHVQLITLYVNLFTVFHHSHVMVLRHKRIENTIKYIGMLHFKDDEFEVTTATTVEEAKQVLTIGFDYITEKNGIMLFRRPKRFRGINADKDV